MTGPRRKRPFDLVVFWKQNDSDIYGRRSDLLIAEIARSSRVARTIHFDAPLGIAALERMRHSTGFDHNHLVFDTTLARVHGRADDARFWRRTFLYDDSREHGEPACAIAAATRCADVAPNRQAFGDYVADVLARRGVGDREVVFWLYPTHPDLPALVDRFQPNVVVTDIVDDNRTWYARESPEWIELSANYAAILDRSHVALANCAGVAGAMAEFGRQVEVVPNACEPVTDRSLATAAPDDLAALPRPIVGYVGNLSSRIDVALIEHIATARPGWSIVLVGSTHAGHDVLALRRLPNVALLGPRRHDEAKRYMAAFDVAIIPHLDNTMTRAMQPLKAFVYCAVGAPVVSTNVANLDDLAGLITVADGGDAFVEAIDAALVRGRVELSPAQRRVLRNNSWPVRARRALQLIDEALA